MNGDNYRFLLCAVGREGFEQIMALAFECQEREEQGGRGRSATHYAMTADLGLILYWTSPDDAGDVKALPYPMDCKAATEFAWNWLKTADYGPEPDHDGSNSKGFTVANQDWGHVRDHWQAFVYIKPTWQMYGK